ncbi:MAG: response regulator [Calditrichia bacterium]
MKIFLVDDDISRMKLFKDYLEKFCSCKIVQARDPQEALKILQVNLDCDLISLDIMMTVKDPKFSAESDAGMDAGLLLLDKIHDTTKGRIPIVVLTARQDLKKLHNDERVLAYFKKPLSPREYYEKVKELLEG